MAVLFFLSRRVLDFYHMLNCELVIKKKNVNVIRV